VKNRRRLQLCGRRLDLSSGFVSQVPAAAARVPAD
jgi:hypothetical protein